MTMQRRRRRRRSTAENPSLSSVLLPDELIEAILVRLPVSSLLRFKSVCKSWLSVISDPQFAKSQFDLAASPTHRLLLSVTDDLKFQSLDIDSSPPNDDESAVLNYPREQQPYSHDEFGRLLRLNDKGKLLPVYPWDWSWKSRYRLLYSRMYTASILSLPS
uniref:F-box domain-containing protein n=1 Tax=Lotus japonicus TaxID=34305 RepID=I3SZH1_LOTJA|nr:unknown [Lotus japonicus]